MNDMMQIPPREMGVRAAGRRTGLVTGASSGIGAELAKALAARGYDLVLVARRTEPLDALGRELAQRHGVSVRAVRADLSRPDAAGRLWTEVTAAGETVDVLVNNAGSGLHGLLWEEDPDSLGAMLELNVMSLVALTRLALPGMVRRRWGRILNVASIVSFQPGGPRMAAYFASKSFVLSFTQGLRAELKGTGVGATALCPGPTRTSFEERSDLARTPLYRWLALTPARATAEAACRGMERGRGVVVPGLATRVLAFAGRYSPTAIALEVNRWLLTPRRKP